MKTVYAELVSGKQIIFQTDEEELDYDNSDNIIEMHRPRALQIRMTNSNPPQMQASLILLFMGVDDTRPALLAEKAIVAMRDLDPSEDTYKEYLRNTTKLEVVG